MTKSAHIEPATIASYLLPIVKALKSRHVDVEALLAQVGIEETLENDPLTRLPHRQLGEVFRLAVEQTGDARFGIYASRFMLPTHLHALGTALIASRSLMDLCLRVERYGTFLGQTATFYVERDPIQTRFGAHPKVPLRAEATDMFWSFILRLMRNLAPDEFNPVRVDVTVDASPGANDAYSAFFHCPIVFGCDEMALYFDTEALEQELPTASQELARLSDQVVQDYLAKMDKEDLVSRVNSLLVANLPSGDYSKEDAARELHMSARTLQKRLDAAGTSWRELLTATRAELAISYLRSGRYTLAEITFLLGFNDTSSFSRAFKRWTGKSPGSFT